MRNQKKRKIRRLHLGLGSARLSRGGERALAIADFDCAYHLCCGNAKGKACFGGTQKPARVTRPSSLFLTNISTIWKTALVVAKFTSVHFFEYRNERLCCEDVDLSRVAAEFGTPTYVYSAGTILDHYTRLDAALASLDHLICYAVKANSNRAILKLLVDAGAGLDIVSGGELFRVLAAGGDPAKCTFAGVGKSREDIEYALDQRVYCFNIESEA